MTDPGKPTLPLDEETRRVVEAAQAQARAVLAKLPLLGPVAWLCMNAPARKHAFLADLEWLVMPPLVLNQCKLYMKGEAPLAFASWAFLSAEVASRYAATGRLAPGEWKSGDEAWLIDLVAPFGGAQGVLEDLRKSALAGRTIKQLMPADGGGTRVMEWR